MSSRRANRFAGCHVLAEFTGVDPALADDAVRLREILRDALTGAGANVCEIVDKRFDPSGVTVLALLAESHASMHTYPERGALFVDVFTCGDAADAEQAVRLLGTALGAPHAHIRVLTRGSGGEITEEIALGLTRSWQLLEVICDVRTAFQHLIIARTEQGVTLFLDGERQSTSFSQLVYHEALLVPALLLAPKIERVLVIGSGEGVLSQIAVRAGAKHVDHVDIDREAVRLCAEHLPYGYSTHELLKAESGDGPITMHYGDGWGFVNRVSEPYDIVVIDLPDEGIRSTQHNLLYGADFLSRCRAIGTVVVSQAGCPTLWRNNTLRRSWQRFRDTFPTVVYFASDEHEWAFLSGSTEGCRHPVATMKGRLAALPYRPRTIDADTLAASTVPPMTLRSPR